jgi:hypothetical protein
MKDEGLGSTFAQKIVTDILIDLRNSVTVKLTEEKEDLILDLLDTTAGWCQAKYRIWE